MKKRSLVVTNLIGFIVGTFIFGIAGVYAVTYFSSTNTAYDNSSSGMSSTNVQTAIDELYNVCKTTAGEQIIEDNNLEKDPYECRYFFTGANPNNYITFNNETAGWRIISVGCDNTIKIMHDENIGNQEWDTNGNNYWGAAELNTYLNGDYYNDFLNSTAKSQIVAASYGAGNIESGNNDLGDQINDENNRAWFGNVALPTLSEYYRTNSNANCKTYKLNQDNYNTCKNSTWMFKNYTWWPLNMFPGNKLAVGASGQIVDAEGRYAKYAVRPVVTLSAEVQITGGDGSSSNPYTIE